MPAFRLLSPPPISHNAKHLHEVQRQSHDFLNFMCRWFFKGLNKKLVALGNERGCGIVQEWIPSIINHLYWCAVSTPTGDAALMRAKWMSLINHIHNVHIHNDPHFPCCLHGPLVDGEREKVWIPHGNYHDNYKYLPLCNHV